jgi:hypothetical protein
MALGTIHEPTMIQLSRECITHPGENVKVERGPSRLGCGYVRFPSIA